MESADVLRVIEKEVAACTRCELQYSRKNTVTGAGSAKAEIMFIGEGPGFHENEQGLPFVGAAGKFLDELLDSVGLERSEVYITNVVKCRPPGNRDPQLEELTACKEYLERQIRAINPKVIVTLGRFSMQRYLPHARISEVHGKCALHAIRREFEDSIRLHEIRLSGREKIAEAIKSQPNESLVRID